MARRPQRMPRWAYDPPAGALIEPPSSEQEDGWATGQKPPAQYLNWLLHHYSAWCDFLRGASLARWEIVALAYSTSVLTFGALSVDDSTAESTSLITRNVIAAIDGGGNCVFTSVRGQVWTRRTNFTATGTFYRARYLGGRHWICVDHATAGVLLTVAGGSAVLSGTGSWTASTLPASTEGVRGIAYDDTSGWYAAITRTKPIASSGPASWADATLGSVPTGTFLDIAWSGTAFLAVTDDGEVYKASGGSAAGGTWTALSPLAATGAWRLSEGPDGQIVAWRENTGATLSFYVTTNDGTTWTEVVSSPSVERVRSLRYTDSIWVAATTEAPYLWQSNDLTNWTRLKLPYDGSTAVFDAAYSEGAWIAVRDAESLVSARAEDIATGTWAADPTPTALSDAAYLRGRAISTSAPSDLDVLTWINATSKWTPRTPAQQRTALSLGAAVTGTAQTTNNTTATLATIATSSGTTVTVQVTVMAAKDDESKAAAWTLLGCFSNAAGTLTQLGTTQVLGPTDATPGYVATFDTSGTDIRVRITGATGETVNWSVNGNTQVI